MVMVYVVFFPFFSFRHWEFHPGYSNNGCLDLSFRTKKKKEIEISNLGKDYILYPLLTKIVTFVWMKFCVHDCLTRYCTDYLVLCVCVFLWPWSSLSAFVWRRKHLSVLSTENGMYIEESIFEVFSKWTFYYFNRWN